MSNEKPKPVRSPSYPSLALRDAVDAVGKIEGRYRSAAVDRAVAARLIGFSSLSGPANKALAALAAYGLLERAGKGEARVTERTRAILHANSEQERRGNLRAAALEPSLFRELRERFDGIAVPPEEGVVTFLHRQGFNPTAIRPAAKAFLQTMSYLEELRAIESHGSKPSNGRESATSDGKPAAETYGGAQVGDFVQWESQGAFQFPEPRRVRLVTEDGKWVAVEGSETGLPMNEIIVQDQPPQAENANPPKFAMEHGQSAGRLQEGEVEWTRSHLGAETTVRILVKGALGPREIKKLVRLLEAQREVLLDDDGDEQNA